MTDATSGLGAPTTFARLGTLQPATSRSNPSSANGPSANGSGIDFAAAMRQIESVTAQIPTTIDHTRARSVEAHTVVYENGRAAASVMRDGGVRVSDRLAAKMGSSLDDVLKRADGMTPEARRAYIADALAKAVGANGRTDRFGETGAAPTRGDLQRLQWG